MSKSEFDEHEARCAAERDPNYNDYYFSEETFISGARWQHQQDQKILNIAKDAIQMVSKAKEFYGPAGFRHVSNVLAECDSLKREVEALRIADRHIEGSEENNRWLAKADAIAKERQAKNVKK